MLVGKNNTNISFAYNLIGKVPLPFTGGTSISGVRVGFFSSGTVLLRMAGPLRYNLLLRLLKLFGRS